MKKAIKKLLAVWVIVFCVGLTGCGGTVSTEDKNAEEAISGRAVSETAVVHQGQNKGRCCTDTNLYT